jgi:putative glutamine amidotransferase
MKPKIGILTNILTVTDGIYQGGQRIYVNRDYVVRILEAGGIPILLPIIDDQETILRQIELVDGVLLSGGQDVSPHYYSEEPHPQLGEVNLERDHFELEVIKHAVQLKKPMLGVCRGCQVLNVAFGGSLHQHLDEHTQTLSREKGTQLVKIERSSLLYGILEKEEISTNTFHHQAVKKIAPGFVVSARASDGTIEGIESEMHDFVIGVQWHPEMMSDLEMKKLFKALVDEASKHV